MAVDSGQSIIGNGERMMKEAGIFEEVEPDEEDPFCGETAEEAYEAFKETGLVNPFHVEEIARMAAEENETEFSDEPGEDSG